MFHAQKKFFKMMVTRKVLLVGGGGGGLKMNMFYFLEIFSSINSESNFCWTCDKKLTHAILQWTHSQINFGNNSILQI